MFRFIAQSLPCRKTLLVLLVLLTVSLLQHTFIPTKLLRAERVSSRNAILAQHPFQTSHTFYKHSEKVSPDKQVSSDSRVYEYATQEHLYTPVEYKLFDWHMLLYQSTLHKKDYA